MDYLIVILILFAAAIYLYLRFRGKVKSSCEQCNQSMVSRAKRNVHG